MSEEQFTRIEAKIDRAHSELADRIDDLGHQVRVMNNDLSSRIDERRSQIDDLGHQMRLLHEDVIERIKDTQDPAAMLRREIRQGDGEVRDEMDRRVQPIEVAVREHSAEIDKFRKWRS